jgi:hypothetical protein
MRNRGRGKERKRRREETVVDKESCTPLYYTMLYVLLILTDRTWLRCCVRCPCWSCASMLRTGNAQPIMYTCART